MANVSQQESPIARVYAESMLKLAEKSGQVDALAEELLDFAQRVEQDADLDSYLSSPLVDSKTRRELLEKLFRGRRSDLFVDSCQVLNHKGRLGLIRSVAQAYRRAREELAGRVPVHVTSAAPMSKRQRARVGEVAGEFAGMQPDIVETVDESLIGGLVIQIGDRKYDASVATKLKTLAGALLERASREIHGDTEYVERVGGSPA